MIDDMPEVAESAVIGLAHPDFGEAVCAVLVLKAHAELDAATLITRLKSQIANFKVPKQVFFIRELPRNTMGKVQKNLLRQQFQN
jgi:malonyl-CoA/methylmalonyl-CoA synthetase